MTWTLTFIRIVFLWFGRPRIADTPIIAIRAVGGITIIFGTNYEG